MFNHPFLSSLKLSVTRNGFIRTIIYIVQYGQFKLFGRTNLKLGGGLKISSINVRSKTSDFSVFRQIFMDGEYDIYPLEVPSVIVDIGANIGLASIYFHNRFPSSTIIALEPDKSNYDLLVLNTNATVNIFPLRLAVWNKKMDLQLVDNGLDRWGLQVREADHNGEEIVKGIDIASLMKQNGIERIDLLKIDVEGAEKQIFSGDYSEWLPKVRVLIIELHDHLIPGCSEAFEKAISTIPHKKSRKGENIVVYNLD